MPTYTYECNECDNVVTARRPVDKRDDLMFCQACPTGMMGRKLEAPAVNMNGQEAAK